MLQRCIKWVKWRENGLKNQFSIEIFVCKFENSHLFINIFWKFSRLKKREIFAFSNIQKYPYPNPPGNPIRDILYKLLHLNARRAPFRFIVRNFREIFYKTYGGKIYDRIPTPFNKLFLLNSELKIGNESCVIHTTKKYCPCDKNLIFQRTKLVEFHTYHRNHFPRSSTSQERKWCGAVWRLVKYFSTIDSWT